MLFFCFHFIESLLLLNLLELHFVHFLHLHNACFCCSICQFFCIFHAAVCFVNLVNCLYVPDNLPTSAYRMCNSFINSLFCLFFVTYWTNLISFSVSFVNWFLQGVSIACYASPVLAIVGMSVRLFVCLSPASTEWKRRKPGKRRKLGSRNSLPTDSTRTLVFGVKTSYRNSEGFTPSEGIKWEWRRKNSQFSANKSQYLRNGAS